MKPIVLFFLVLLVSQAPAEIYKWVDAQGNVHYSDEPQAPGAKRMRQLPGLSTYSPPPLPSKPPQEEVREEFSGELPEKAPPAAHPGYQVLKIVSPENEGTVRSSPGEVPIFVALSPVLREGDYFRVLLDGKLLPEHHSSTVIRLSNVDRGEHKVAVAVYSKDGKKLLQSDTHTFYLHRTIAKRPAPRAN
ncbi:MAG: hypothetical protein DSZ02_07840 [Gammaproteobacteria bacterium]|nr:MAG: hypothetical protein DSZ02_07840 [Gammaproteobacteria bacterium]